MYHYQKSFRYRRFCTRCRIVSLKLRNFGIKVWKLLKAKAAGLKVRAIQVKPHLHHKRTMQRAYGDKKIKPLPLSGVKFQYKKLPIPELNNSRR